jgi:hypothetical protein
MRRKAAMLVLGAFVALAAASPVNSRASRGSRR